MCLPMDSCFGFGFGAPRTDDDHYHAPAASRTQQPHGQRNGGSHYSGNSNGTHNNGNGKASNDARRGHAHVVPAGGCHGHAATGAQEKGDAYPYAGADGMLKQQPYDGADGTLKQQQPAAPNCRVAAADGQGARGVAQHNYYYYKPAHKEDATDCYYSAATATADHESASEALGGD